MKTLISFLFFGLCMLQTAQAQFVNAGGSAPASIYYNGAGNVGIGTSAPAHKLDVQASFGLNRYLARIHNTDVTGRGLWVMQTQSSTSDAQQQVARFSKMVGTIETVLMIIRTDNKVCIGTTLTTGPLPSDANEYRLFVKDGIRTEKVKVDLAACHWLGRLCI